MPMIFDDEEDGTILVRSRLSILNIPDHRVGFASFDRELEDSCRRADDGIRGIGTEGKDEDDNQNNEHINVDNHGRGVDA